MGREGVPVVPPTLIARSIAHRTIHFVLTNISFSYNVETTARTTWKGVIYCAPAVHPNSSRGNFN